MTKPLIATLALAVLLSAPAAEARSLPFGFVDDAMKWTDTPGLQAARGRGLGADTFRMTLAWQRGQTALTVGDKNAFDRVGYLSPRPRVVLTVYGSARQSPQTLAHRRQYCLFVATALSRWPWIKDVVIWNEVNKAYFWRPQFAGTHAVAPAAYGRLLATCWDILHIRHRSVNLVTSLSPRRGGATDAAPLYFLGELGQWYRTSKRAKPLFDTWGQNAYGPTSRELPTTRHVGGTIGMGDYGKLMNGLRLAFGGTRQPLPSASRRKLWYIETGYQTGSPAPLRAFYSGFENVPVLPATGPLSQTSQLKAAIKLAYCQEAVGFLLNFLLVDETRREGWQSGLFYADGTRKASWTPVRSQILAARAGTLHC